MRKNAKELLRAMKMIENGSSINAVSKTTGICNQTLSRYWGRYKTGGETIIFDHRSYSPSLKLKIVKESEKKGVSSVANAYGIPSKTIRQWMEQSKNNPAGILDKRKKEERNMETTHLWTIICDNSNTTLLRLSISQTSTARAITKALTELHPFSNPVFNAIFIHIQDICQLVYEDKGYSHKNCPLDDDDASLIAVTALTIWKCSQYDHQQLQEAKAWLEEPEIRLFILEYIQTAFEKKIFK